MSHGDDSRPIPFPQRRQLDIRALADRTALYDAEESGPRPRLTDDCPVLRRWSIAPVGGCPCILGIDDGGHIMSIEIEAYATDGTWARRLDGSYVRLQEPWPLPLPPEAGR
ncbi:hypothetical protein H9Q09_10295 [Aurantimonas sp. DM33-3]|uniref:hypothetical protein n=1 Tax=Aurantimonas sp. DM33-3 TaxID=2766955 RepID=UPI001651D496|nr:hypothetical protein [Aurantimonas sp. DM33-3]MBC6716595.1 hypothetical protein [Aurantimonas sp. DM33-3]